MMRPQTRIGSSLVLLALTAVACGDSSQSNGGGDAATVHSDASADGDSSRSNGGSDAATVQSDASADGVSTGRGGGTGGLGGAGGIGAAGIGAGGIPTGGINAGGLGGNPRGVCGGRDGDPTGGVGGVGGQLSELDLEGGWTATLVSPSGMGGDTILHKRLRFEGDTYALVWSSRSSYCAEVGTFQLTAAGIAFQPGHAEGFGTCAAGPSRTERVSRTAAGLAFEAQGGLTTYLPIRKVPKVFATFATHDGNFAGDATLPGSNAIEKADAFCAQSAARPDGGRYHAMLWDGTTRPAPPDPSGVLRPQTTYFEADGVRNVFTTDTTGAPTYHQKIVADYDGIQYFWAYQGCQGWTSDSTSLLSLLVDTSQPDLISVSGACGDLPGVGILCVGEGDPIGPPPEGGTDGGPAGGAAGTTSLQGGWRRLSGSENTCASATVGPNERLRFSGNGYTLVYNDASKYCAELGTFDATSSNIRFVPNREEGVGGCLIGDVRTAVLATDADGITLTFASGAQVRYVRQDAVPKIFVTVETHDGDFLHDPALPGAHAMAKADAFCNRSIAKPDDQVYKAALVDATNRSATPLVDWVLKQRTRYFQASGERLMFVSDQQYHYDEGAKFTNPFLTDFGRIEYMWSGMNRDFTTSSDTCQGWSSRDPTLRGGMADMQSDFGYRVLGACNYHLYRLSCVSQ